MHPGQENSGVHGPREVARKRVARACDRCRLKKGKCDGKEQCAKCVSADIMCIYTDRKPPQYKAISPAVAEALQSENFALKKACILLFLQLHNNSPPPLEGVDWLSDKVASGKSGRALNYIITQAGVDNRISNEEITNYESDSASHYDDGPASQHPSPCSNGGSGTMDDPMGLMFTPVVSSGQEYAAEAVYSGRGLPNKRRPMQRWPSKRALAAGLEGSTAGRRHLRTSSNPEPAAYMNELVLVQQPSFTGGTLAPNAGPTSGEAPADYLSPMQWSGHEQDTARYYDNMDPFTGAPQGAAMTSTAAGSWDGTQPNMALGSSYPYAAPYMAAPDSPVMQHNARYEQINDYSMMP